MWKSGNQEFRSIIFRWIATESEKFSGNKPQGFFPDYLISTAVFWLGVR
jgi:hypothetical protein